MAVSVAEIFASGSSISGAGANTTGSAAAAGVTAKADSMPVTQAEYKSLRIMLPSM
jgi:hypothetical protein